MDRYVPWDCFDLDLMKYNNSDNNLYDDMMLWDIMISGHKCYNNN